MDISLDSYKNAIGQKVVHFREGNVHLIVAPHTILEEDGTLKNFGCEVYVYGDRKGQVDTDNELNSIVMPGDEEDQEEIADTYARRHATGIKPEHIFDDTLQRNREQMTEVKIS